MKSPNPITVANAIKDTHPQLAVDILRSCGYTKRAAQRAIIGEGDPCKDLEGTSA